MLIKQTIKNLIEPIRRLPLKKKVIIGVSLGIVVMYTLIFSIPKHVTFSYSGQSCTDQITLLPAIMKQTRESGFEFEFTDDVVIAGKTILSLKTCFKPTQAPTVGRTVFRLSPFGSLFAGKKYVINVAASPVVAVADFIDKTHPTSRPIVVGLTTPDETFTYKLQLSGQIAPCDQKDAELSCDIVPLDLAQGVPYDVSMIRYFGDTKIDTIVAGTITTLKAVTLVDSTIKEGQTVYEKPTRFTIEYDKPLETVVVELKVKNGETFELVTTTATIDNNKLIVSPTKDLARSSQYELTLKKVEAIDGSALDGEQKVNFTLSGGPKVEKINVGNTGVAKSGTIVVTFDQEIANTDNLDELVTVQGLITQISQSGKSLVISYSNAPQCGSFTLEVKKGLESQYGIAQQDDWGFTGRMQCYSVQTIGFSAHGRAINAFIFGSGSKTILYTAAMHGNEQSGKMLMNSWINELDTYAQNIPTGVRLVVIPAVNPDGVAMNIRYNANGVDLNRNYNTSDWQTDTQTVSGAALPGGGGSSPGSEPETQALMAYTIALQPSLTMSYHSSASYVIANTCGNSAALATTYAGLTGYRNMTGVYGAFSYQITGTYDDWMCERLGFTSVLIELATGTNAEFSRNRAALWAMARS